MNKSATIPPPKSGQANSESTVSQKIVGNSVKAVSKILIVDDEPVNVKVTQKYLEADGYRNFVTTTDSREALELIIREEA